MVKEADVVRAEDGQRLPSTAVVVVFGASGDLTRRKVVPALHSLRCVGQLPNLCRLIGVARTKMTDKKFREELYVGVEDYSRLRPDICGIWPGYSKVHQYLSGDYDNPETYVRLHSMITEALADCPSEAGVLFYLATPPALFPVIVKQLKKAGFNRLDGRPVGIVVEKPFGQDLASAQKLNCDLHGLLPEDSIFRIDHYLGKETVQNVLAFRFANAIFEPLWNRNYVANVQVTAAESISVGERGKYYDVSGVVRDMLQNHLLQVMSLVALEPPALWSAKALRDEKLKVLQSIRPISPEDVVLGQYQGYLEEEGVAPDSKTPTFVAARLFVDNWRWRGVPFYLRTGKRLAAKTTNIILKFRDPPHLFLPTRRMLPNRLVLSIQPDEGVQLRFQTKVPGMDLQTSPVEMEFHYSQEFGDKALADAYERLLLDAMLGDPLLFARSDEIERSWEVVTPLLTNWDGALKPWIHSYEPDSWGPEAAEALLKASGFSWCEDVVPEQAEDGNEDE